MSEIEPPNPYPLNPIFNVKDWIYNDTTLTIAEANKLYLRKKGDTATGLLNFSGGLTCSGNCQINCDITISSTYKITQSDLTSNTNPNIFRPTYIYGDLNLKRPTANNGGALRLWDVASNSGNSFQLYDSGITAYLVNLNNSGNFVVNLKDVSGNSNNALNISPTDMTISTTNPPTCGASSTILLTDNSTKLPSTAWVRSYISSLPSTQYTYTQLFSGSTGVGNITIPTGCVKFDIKVFGTGGLAGGLSIGVPDGSHIDYYYKIGGTGGGAGVAYKEGIPMIKQGVYYTNTLTYDNSSGTSATGFCEVKFNGVSICKAYNGGTATITTGGLGCSTAPFTNTTWGNWTYWNGNNGQNGSEDYINYNVGQVGGGNFNGGIIGYNYSGTTQSNQGGQGQQYSALTGPTYGFPANSPSPINRGGCIISWYVQS